MSHAVLIGIDEYQYFPCLKYAQSDANSLHEKLTLRAEGAFQVDNVRLLVNTSVGTFKPMRTNILVALRGMCKQAVEGDLILFYFAGHGFDVGGTSYLVTSDSHPTVLEDTALKVDDILSTMNTSNAAKKVLILDACRKSVECEAQTRAPSPLSDRSFTSTLERTLKKQAESPGWELIVACGPDQFAWEDDELGGGVWTNSLIKVIDELGPRRDITVRTLFEMGKGKVEQWAERSRKGPQVPYYRCDSADSAVILHATDAPVVPAVAPGTSSLISLQTIKDEGIRVLVQEEQFLKLTDNWDANSDKASVHMVRFSSEVKRPDLREWGGDCLDSNQNYHLRLYLPSQVKFRPPHKRLFLLFNGLGEADPFIFDDIGLELAERHGIPSILMPLPRHFTRHCRFPSHVEDPFRPETQDKMRLATQSILQEVICTPSRIIHGYRQTMSDARFLLRSINDGYHPYWSQIFQIDVSVSLLGYSIGGFAALALLLLEPERYKSVFLLESGAFIDQIDAGVLFWRPEKIQKLLWEVYYEKRETLNEDRRMEKLFSSREQRSQEDFEMALAENNPDKCGFNEYPWRVFERTEIESREIWRDIVGNLYSVIDKEGDLLTGEEAQIFRRVFLGHEKILYQKQLADLSNKILITVGGADDIFPARLLLNVGPDTGLAMVQIPKITHWIKYKSRKGWIEWKNVFIDIMEKFDSMHPFKK